MEAKQWSAAYQRYRNARSKHALIKARLDAGRDIETGLKPDERERLALLTEWQREYEWFVVAGRSAAETLEAIGIVIVESSVDVAASTATPEFQREVNSILKDAIASRERLVSALPHSNKEGGDNNADE